MKLRSRKWRSELRYWACADIDITNNKADYELMFFICIQLSFYYHRIPEATSGQTEPQCKTQHWSNLWLQCGGDYKFLDTASQVFGHIDR